MSVHRSHIIFLQVILASSLAISTVSQTFADAIIPQPITSGVVEKRVPASPDLTPFVAWLEEQIDENHIPGVAMAVMTVDQVLSSNTWGVRQLDKPDPIDVQTLFRIASVSKTFAGAVTAQLVGEHKQDWDRPLLESLPQLAIGTGDATKTMTLRHLMSHSTGLMPHAYSNMLDAGVAYDKIQEKFQEIPTVCSPGRCYGYQNVVFSLVSDLVVQSYDASYEAYVQEHIFEPLGMKDSSVGLEGYVDSLNVSAPHQYGRNSWRVASTNAAYYTVAPAAGVNSSLEDMIIWAQANLGAAPQVLSLAMLAEQQTPQVETPRGNYFNRWPHLDKAWYGLGWRVFDYSGERVIHHGGGVRGFRTELVLVPARNIAMVVLFNAETSVANEVVPQFLDTIIQ